MEDKKTILDYLAEVLIVFGFSMLIMNIFCLIFGNSAREYSAMFALGSRGIPVNICFQFLFIAFLTTGIRALFFTDMLIKNMHIWTRTICMLSIIIIIIAVFAVIFHWFPVDMWQPWVMFLICFGLSFLGSYFIMTIKEKTENKRMEEALEKLKEKEKKTK